MEYSLLEEISFTSLGEGGENSLNPHAATIEEQEQDRPAKRKRNKPTLSCGECVERKTKVGLLSVF
jgi:hypothetical protein